MFQNFISALSRLNVILRQVPGCVCCIPSNKLHLSIINSAISCVREVCIAGCHYCNDAADGLGVVRQPFIPTKQRHEHPWESVSQVPHQLLRMLLIFKIGEKIYFFL